MKLLPHLILSTSLLSFSGAGLSHQTTNPEDSITSSLKSALNSEEIRYILLECEDFANEDGISPDKRSDYLDTCINELSAAVRDALERRPNKPEPLIINTEAESA